MSATTIPERAPIKTLDEQVHADLLQIAAALHEAQTANPLRPSTRSRARAIALTHIETAALWLKA